MDVEECSKLYLKVSQQIFLEELSNITEGQLHARNLSRSAILLYCITSHHH
jgi:hypothetical protein